MDVGGRSALAQSRPKRLEAQSRTRQGAGRSAVKEPQAREITRTFHHLDPRTPGLVCQARLAARRVRIRRMVHALRVLVPLLAAVATARAQGPRVEGDYESPLGRVRITGSGATFRGVLVVASDLCSFHEGDEVIRATLLDDSLAGQVRVCLAGKGCRARDEWSSAVLLASGERLSGAVHVGSRNCRAPLGKNGGLAFVRVAAKAAPAAN